MKILKTLLLIVVPAIIVGYAVYLLLNNPIKLSDTSTKQFFLDFGNNNSLNNQEVAKPPSESAKYENVENPNNIEDNQQKSSTLGTKTHNNLEGDFQFTYPAELGSVMGEKVGKSTKNGDCQNNGFSYHGTFSNNPNIDFAFISTDFFDCEGSGSLLFDTKNFTLAGNKLNLYSWNKGNLIKTANIETTIPTTSPEIIAYVFKDATKVDTNDTLAVIVDTPNANIGPLIFRILNTDPNKTLNYSQSLEIFRAIIAN